MLKPLVITSTSAAFEWQNELPYYSDGKYTVILNGKRLFTDERNVFSVFSLTPDTEYELSSPEKGVSLRFRTKAEACAVSVHSFGAVGDGVAEDTVAFQSAINCLPRGGRLFVPKGNYLIAPLSLKSHMTLELEEGAALIGIPDKTKYPKLPGEIPDIVTGDAVHFGTWEGNAVPMHQALLFAEYAEDISIVGRGRVNGNAEAAGWWEDIYNYTHARPRLVFFNRCKNILIHGITAENSASWQLHPYFSENIDFIDLEIKAPAKSPNTDAIDPEACDRVDIIGCRFSVGDDCIAIKSGKIELGRKYKRAATRHTVRNCLMHSGHGAVVLGSEIAGGVRELSVSRCVFEGTDRGLRIKTRRGRGENCYIDGITFENIRMVRVGNPIVMNMYYNCCDPDRHSDYVKTREPLPVDGRTPYLGSFVFKNLTCLESQATAAFCDGLPEQPIASVTLDGVYVTMAEDAKPSTPASQDDLEPHLRRGFIFKHLRRLVLKNVTLEGNLGERLTLSDVGEVIEE